MKLARIGRFEIQRVLGSGGFATVWLARDEELDSLVAVKVLAENWSLHEDARRRFTEEARALRRLDSDRIVRVYEVATLPDGRPCMVMEFADGGSLQDRIRQRLGFRQPFSVQEAVGLSVEIAECLAAVHDLGIVHRDLKPSNVLFKQVTGRRQPEERLLLADFGIARRLEGVATSGRVVGSPAYMAPEQADPERSASVDPRSDVYSAAAVLYEMLAGHVPFEYESIEAVRAGLREAPPLRRSRPEVPEQLAGVVARGMAPDPDQRFGSAREWRDALLAATAPEAAVEAGSAGGGELVGAGVGRPSHSSGDGATFSTGTTAPERAASTASRATELELRAHDTELLPSEELPVRNPRPPWSGLRPGAAASLMVVGAIAVVVGALLPWTRVGGGSESLGVDGTGGLLALAGGASALGAGLGLIWLRRTSSRALAVAGGLGGLVAALAAFSEFPRVRNELIEFVGHAFGATSHGFTALPGVYVALAGGLTILASSISILARRTSRPKS